MSASETRDDGGQSTTPDTGQKWLDAMTKAKVFIETPSKYGHDPVKITHLYRNMDPEGSERSRVRVEFSLDAMSSEMEKVCTGDIVSLMKEMTTTDPSSSSDIHNKLSKKSLTLCAYTQRNQYGNNMAHVIDTIIPGLYFCATTPSTTKPELLERFPPSSPYGSVRVAVPLEDLALEQCTLFFLSYHIVGSNNYVVIGIVPQGKDVGEFERRGMPQLEPSNNIFFWTHNGSWYYKRGFWIEIFYVGDVEHSFSRRWMFQNNIKVTGRNITTTTSTST